MARAADSRGVHAVAPGMDFFHQTPKKSPAIAGGLPQFNTVFWGHIQFVVFCDVERIIPRVNVR